jgi:hypothetical protein
VPLTELERYEQAAAWREKTLPLVRDALGKLREARKACPTSVEAVQLERAVSSVRDALKECERSLVVARRMIDREKRRP